MAYYIQDNKNGKMHGKGKLILSDGGFFNGE
jgi:hypothetical protein